jgi:hypothetical protein
MSNNGSAGREWCYRLEFDGGAPLQSYTSPDIRTNNPGWGDLGIGVPISQIEFFLPTGHKIVMRGMRMYNFFIEALQSFAGNTGAQLSAVYLCGLHPNQDIVDVWCIGNGVVKRTQAALGSEYEGTATRGWKNGNVAVPFASEVV